MTYWMDNAAENRRALMNLADPLTPQTVEGGVGVFDGAPGALADGIKYGVDQLAVAVGDTTTPYLQDFAQPIDDLLGTNAAGWLEDQRQRAHDIMRSNRLDPNTTGFVGQVLHGAGSVITQAALGYATGGGTLAAAGVAGGGTGYGEYTQLLEMGVDPETAKSVAGITAVDTAVGVALPFKLGGGGLGGTVAWGVGTNVGLGAVGRYDAGNVLAQAGYTEMAEQYKALDATALATDALMGAAFPLVGKAAERFRQPGAAEEARKALDDALSPEQKDALDVAARRYQEEVEASPGLHKSPDSLNAHLEAMRTVEDAVVRGEDPMSVNLDPIVQRMDLEPDLRKGDRRAEDRGTGEREGERRVREPHEILREDFESRARAAGLTEDVIPNARDIIEALAPKQEVDSATGWNNLQGKKFIVKEVVKDAMAVAEETGQKLHYVSMDLQNLGGLNAFYKEVYSLSDAEFGAIMAIAREELDKIGGSAYMRTGGDELSAVVTGSEAAAIEAAMARAFGRIAKYAKKQGYGDIKHAKGKPVKGVNVYSGFQEIRPGMSAGKVIDAADAAMGVKKQAAIDAAEAALKEAGNVDGKPVEAAGDGTPGREGRGDQPGAGEAPRAADGGTEGGSEPVRGAFDPADPEAVARTGDISSLDDAAVKQVLDADPDLTVPHPETGQPIKARDLMAELDREIATAKQDGELAQLAVACFKTFGE